MPVLFLAARLALAGLCVLYLYRAYAAAGPGAHELVAPGWVRANDPDARGSRGTARPAELEVEAGPGSPGPGDRFAVAGRVALGRAPDCDIVICDPYVSARHAEISLAGSTYRLRDLGSTNGTYLNGRRIRRERALRPGDLVRLGDTRLRFRG